MTQPIARQQPIDVSVDISVEAETVGDLLTLAQFLTDLGVSPNSKLHDEVTIALELPVKAWEASHPATLTINLDR